MVLKKVAKILLVVLVVWGVLYLSLPTLVNIYLNKNAERIVTDMITRTSDFAGHEVKFGDIYLDYGFKGTLLRLRDVDIYPGEAIIDKDKIRFYLTLKQANLTGFLWRDFLLDNSIRLDSAHLEELELRSITPPFDTLELSQAEDNKEEGEDYDKISVNHIRVNKLSFENKDSYTDSARLVMKDLFLFADSMVLTKEDLDNPNALFSISQIQGYMDEATVHLNEYRNSITAKDLSFDTNDEKLIIDNIIFENKLGKYEYMREFEKETDWIYLHQGRLEVSGMDFKTYFSSSAIHAKRLYLENPELEVFRDKRKPEDKVRRPKMIHQIIKSLTPRIRIDTIAIESMKVSYEERPDNKAPRAGKIFFDNLNATIYPFTNYEEDLAASDTMHLTAEARLMGKGKINLSIKYFLNDEKGKFTMRGSVGSFDMTELNRMVEPATKVAVKKGKLNDLYFNITANDYEGTGEVIAKYEDLEIEILDKDFGRDQNIFQRIGSFLANKLVVKSQNPDRKGELKKGAVYEIRAQNKFIFNYWWKLLFSGLKSTITGDTEEDLRKKAKE